MKFCKGSLIVARFQKINKLYLMHVQICREEVNMASENAGELWHKRLCHMSYKGMWTLAKDNLIPEEKDVQLEKCTDYLVGK